MQAAAAAGVSKTLAGFFLFRLHSQGSVPQRACQHLTPGERDQIDHGSNAPVNLLQRTRLLAQRGISSQGRGRDGQGREELVLSVLFTTDDSGRFSSLSLYLACRLLLDLIYAPTFVAVFVLLISFSLSFLVWWLLIPVSKVCVFRACRTVA